jgi:hypothetical protein
MNRSRRLSTFLLVCVAGLIAGSILVSRQAGLAQDAEVEPVLIDKFEVVKSSQSNAGVPEFLPRLSAIEQEIVAALNNPTEVTFRDNDLGSALDFLKDRHGIEIWVDKVRVNVEDYAVTLESSKVSLRSCLNLILEPHGLCYLIEDDVLKVTTQEAAETKLITRTYPVSDLFDGPEEAEELASVLECGLGLTHQEDAPPPLKISIRSRAIILRQTHQVHNRLLQLLRDLRTPTEGQTTNEVAASPASSEL